VQLTKKHTTVHNSFTSARACDILTIYMPFKEGAAGRKREQPSSQEKGLETLQQKHATGAVFSRKERGVVGKMLGEAKRAGDTETAETLQRLLQEQGARKQQPKPPENPGAAWTHRSNPDLHTSYAVRQAARHHRHRTESTREKKGEQATELWLNRIEALLKEGDPEKLNTLRKLLHRTFVIKEDAIPASYWESYQNRLRNEGHGTVTITEEMQQAEAASIIADQRSTLDQWFDYLTSQDALYPLWTKYWALQGACSLARYDKKRKQFTKRDAETVAPFPDINREALATITDIIQKKVHQETINNPTEHIADSDFNAVLNTMDFGKYYAFALEHVTISNETLFETITGAWVTYPQGSDHLPLVESIQGHGTGWCTAGEETAKTQLEIGDFHVYYSHDLLGEPTIPRVAIRMQEGSIAEVRGVAPDQNFDPYITPVVEEKLHTFSDGEQYQQRVADMARLTDIERKTQEGQELPDEDLRFLYELDRAIVSPGYQPDPRIQELQDGRDVKHDLSSLFNCRADQISLTEADALSGDIVYHRGDLILSSITSADGLQLPDRVEGGLHLDGLTSADGLKLPEYVGGYLDLSSITSADNLQLPAHVGGDLNLFSITSADGLQLPAHAGGDLYLDNITSADGLQLPDRVEGGLYLDGLTSADDLQLPAHVGGTLDLSSITSADNLRFPEYVGGDLYLYNLTTADDLKLPAHVEGYLGLENLTSADDLQLPAHVGGTLNLSNLTAADDLQLPAHVGGTLYLYDLTSAERTALKKDYPHLSIFP